MSKLTQSITSPSPIPPAYPRDRSFAQEAFMAISILDSIIDCGGRRKVDDRRKSSSTYIFKNRRNLVVRRNISDQRDRRKVEIRPENERRKTFIDPN